MDISDIFGSGEFSDIFEGLENGWKRKEEET